MKSKKTNNEHMPLTKQQTEKLGKTLAQSIRFGMTQGYFKAFDVKEGIKVLKSLIDNHDKHIAEKTQLREQYHTEFERAKKWYLAQAKNGKKSLREMLRILAKFDSEQIQSLCKFIKSLKHPVDYARLLARVQAETNRTWGSPSYIVTNVLNGKKQELVSKNSKAYKVMSAAVNKAKKEVSGEKPGNRLLGLDGVVSVKDGDHYIAFVTGGNNGSSDWATYFKSLTTIVNSMKDAWLIEIKNDCCDDVHYALIGFRL